MAEAEKEMMDKAKRKLRNLKKEARKLKGRNTRAIKAKLCKKMGGERLQPRKMSLVQKAIYNYYKMYNNLPKSIRDQVDA